MIESSPKELDGERGWRHLEERLRPFIRQRVRSEADVDDVLQETFLRMHRGLSSLREDQRFGAWAYRIARNAIVDHLRSSSRQPLAEAREDAQSVDPVDLADADPEKLRREVAGYAAHFVSLLPSPYREALTLTELQGLTQKEAAEMLGISVSGMKSRVQRGRQKLRAALDDCCAIALDARRGVMACESRADDGCCD